MIVIGKNSIETEVDYETGCMFLVDKPIGWTSFDVVNKIRFSLRSLYNRKKFKVGHNGTLDPLASGLLMIFVGRYTKLIPKEENHDKRYDGHIKLGATTESLDREFEEKDIMPIDHITEKDIDAVMATFIGESIQEIPIFAANKINGQPMYKLARKGKVFKPRSKPVVFNDIKLLKYEAPLVEFDLTCGKGTYVRAFARDLGRQLATTAYLYSLRRTQISNFLLEDALSIEEVCHSINQRQ